MLLGCGGHATPPAASAPPAPATNALAAKDTGAPASELRRYWGAAPKHNFRIYGELGALLHTALFQRLEPGLMHLAGDSLGPKQQACVAAVVAGVKELGVSGGQNDGLFLLSFDPKGLDAARSACVGTLVSPDRVTVAGSDEAYAVDGGNVLAVDHHVVLLGSRELVTAALAPHNPGPWPTELTLAPEQRLAAVVDVEGITGHGALFVGPDRFRLQVEGQAPNEAMAQAAEAAIHGSIDQVKDPNAPQGAALSRLLEAFSLTRSGKQVSAVFEVRGPAQTQAELLGMAAATGIYGIRRYVTVAKMAEAEARNTVGQIAKDCAAYVSGDSTSLEKPKHAAPRKLISLPPVPAKVPSGMKYQSVVSDWKAWAPIKFSFVEPQYYQYEVVAAKDGRSAEVIARGDLDGDGKQSRFSRKLTVDPKTGSVTLGLDLEEIDPTE
jgi:hypothetical protein